MKVEIVGLPLDLGADRRGVDMGPSAIRIAGLREKLLRLEIDLRDHGDLQVDVPEVLRVRNRKLKYLREITQATSELAKIVRRIAGRGSFPLVLGGDHSIAIGTIGGMASHFRAREERLGVIWVDAHGDMNTADTTPSGNIHGMPFAVCLGTGAPELLAVGGDFQKVNPRNAVLVGARDLDRREAGLIRKSGISVFTMEEIDRRGIHDVMIKAIKIAGNGTAGIHVSYDMDALDPRVVPGVGTPVRGGLTYREAHAVMETLARSQKMVSLEIVETNPILDVRNATAEVASDLIASALGKRILA